MQIWAWRLSQRSYNTRSDSERYLSILLSTGKGASKNDLIYESQARVILDSAHPIIQKGDKGQLTSLLLMQSLCGRQMCGSLEEIPAKVSYSSMSRKPMKEHYPINGIAECIKA